MTLPLARDLAPPRHSRHGYRTGKRLYDLLLAVWPGKNGQDSTLQTNAVPKSSRPPSEYAFLLAKASSNNPMAQRA